MSAQASAKVKNEVQEVKDKAQKIVDEIDSEKVKAETKLEAAKPALEEAEAALNVSRSPAHALSLFLSPFSPVASLSLSSPSYSLPLLPHPTPSLCTNPPWCQVSLCGINPGPLQSGSRAAFSTLFITQSGDRWLRFLLYRALVCSLLVTSYFLC